MREYWNTLVAAAQQSSKRYQEILSRCTSYRDLQAQESAAQLRYQSLKQQRQQVRQRARSRNSQEEAALNNQLHASLDRLRELRAQLKVAKVEARAQHKAALIAHRAAWDAYVREQRKTTAFHWGNREYLLDTFKTALREAQKKGEELQEKHGPFTELHFRQPYTSGLSVQQLCSQQGRVGIAVDGGRVTGHFLVGQTLLDFDCVYHRPLPDGARLKYFDLIGREVIKPGGRLVNGSYRATKAMWEWRLVVAVEHPPTAPLVRTGSCGIDLGWRMRPDGSLRVGYLVAEQENEEICLPAALIAEFQRTLTLQSEIDTLTEQAMTSIRFGIEEEQVNYPPALVERLKKKRWARSTLFWILRITADDAIRATLERWAHETTRLCQAQRRLSRYCQHYRNDWYRKRAWDLAHGYGEIIIEDLDLRELRKKEKREGKVALKLSEYLGRFANLSFFRQAIIEAAAKTGTIITKKPAAYTTLRCHVCGEIIEQNDGSLFLTCPQGHTIDQDENAGHNLRGDIQAPPKSGDGQPSESAGA